MKPAFYLLPKFAAYRKCFIAQAQWQKQFNSRWSTPFGENTVAAIKRKKVLQTAPYRSSLPGWVSF